MHDLIEKHPDFVSYRSRREGLLAERGKALEANTEQMRAYNAGVVLAANEGAPLPPAPPDPGAIDHAFRAQEAALERAHREWLLANVDELVERAHAREDELIGRAGVLVAELDEMVVELKDLSNTVGQVRRDAHVEKVDPTPAGIDVDSLIDAARRERLLLRPPYAGTIYQGARVSRKVS